MLCFTNQRAGLLQRTSACSAGERALPGDTEPPPHSAPSRFFFLIKSPAFSFPTVIISVCSELLFTVMLFPPHPLTHHPSLSCPQKASENKVSLALSTVQLLISSGWSHAADTRRSREKSALPFFLPPLLQQSQLDRVGKNSIVSCRFIQTIHNSSAVFMTSMLVLKESQLPTCGFKQSGPLSEFVGSSPF